MKKIIAIVLMLCLMIPTCFAAAGDFKSEILYYLDYLDVNVYFDEVEYTGIKRDCPVLDVIYVPECNDIYFIIKETTGYEYTYKTYNMWNIMIASEALASALDCEFWFTDGVAYIFANNNETTRTVYYASIVTTFDDVYASIVDYADIRTFIRLISDKPATV